MTAFYVCMGDSLTHVPTSLAAGVYSDDRSLLPSDEFPFLVARRLRAAGYPDVVECNLGISGNTSAQMVARRGEIVRLGPPAILCVYAGANDPANGAPVDAAASETVLPLPTRAGAAFAPGSFVLVAGESREVAAIDDDVLTLAKPLTRAPDPGASVAIDTRANIVALGAFAMQAGCRRILVGGMHYKNWSSGGDTPDREEPVYAALREAQQKAVADLVALGGEAVYSDRYAFMRRLIVSGSEQQGSSATHSPRNNQHLSRRGHDVIAGADVTTLLTRPEWLAALK